jgi:hypothetical protein
VYRGFTYEFGKYGVQVLDNNDPHYKYTREGGIVYKQGTSGCTYQELKTYVQDYWNADYSLCDNNCQDFARGLLQLLASNCSKIRDLSQQNARLPQNLVTYFGQITVIECPQSYDTKMVQGGAVTSWTSATWISFILPTIMSICGL